jgi:uncharacterized lipoprotein YmbA
LLAIAGCTSPPSRFYTLTSTGKSDGDPAPDVAVLVGPVVVPATVDRPQLTFVSGPNRVEVAEFERWAAPLNESIARAVSGDLSALLGARRVAVAPVADFGPAYHVAIHVERFETMRGEKGGNGEAFVDAVWVLRGPSGQPVTTSRTTSHEPAQGTGGDALAAAHSRGLAKVSRDIAAAIRAAATTQ